MLRVVSSEELPSMLEAWHASFEDAFEVVAYEKEGTVRALAGLIFRDEETIRFSYAFRDDGDDFDFLNAFIPFAQERYPGKMLQVITSAEDSGMIAALRGNGFTVDEVKHHWLTYADDDIPDEEEMDTADEHVTLFWKDEMMFFIYRVDSDVQAVLTCETDLDEDGEGAANIRSVCFRGGYDEEIYRALLHAVLMEAYSCRWAFLFVDDVALEAEPVLQGLGFRMWLETLHCSRKL